MAIHFKNRSGKTVRLENKPIAQGGEGEVYNVLNSSSHPLVAKIYRRDIRKKREPRVHYMVHHPPATQDPRGHHFIIWPEEMLFEGTDFVGFVMRKADGITLQKLTGYILHPELSSDWLKYDRQDPNSMMRRLAVCANLAKAVAAAHSSQEYVLGDLKPSNVKITVDGRIAIIDMDSCQIADSRKARFHAEMKTPAYHPPENSAGILPPSWDTFILGEICYELLCGVHPFTGTLKVPHDKLSTNREKIDHGLFPFGSKASLFDVLPKPHDTFPQLPSRVQQLFRRCFDDGIFDPGKRPSAVEWISALSDPPKVITFDVDRPTIINGVDTTLRWVVDGADTVEISGGIGDVADSGTLTVRPSGPTQYVLKARNIFGTAEKKLDVSVFPTPLLETLMVPMPDYHSWISFKPITQGVPKIDVSIKVDLPRFPEPQAIFGADIDHKAISPPQKAWYQRESLSGLLAKIKGKVSRA